MNRGWGLGLKDRRLMELVSIYDQWPDLPLTPQMVWGWPDCRHGASIPAVAEMIQIPISLAPSLWCGGLS